MLFLRGQALRTMDRFREALSPLQLAVQLDPAENVDIYLALAWCYKRSDQLKKAIESLEEAPDRRCQRGHLALQPRLLLEPGQKQAQSNPVSFTVLSLDGKTTVT